jgi:hypothetical protein
VHVVFCFVCSNFVVEIEDGMIEDGICGFGKEFAPVDVFEIEAVELELQGSHEGDFSVCLVAVDEEEDVDSVAESEEPGGSVLVLFLCDDDVDIAGEVGEVSLGLFVGSKVVLLPIEIKWEEVVGRVGVPVLVEECVCGHLGGG